MMDMNTATPVVTFQKFYNKQANDALKGLIMPVGRLIGFGKHSIVYQGMMVGSNRSVTIKIDERPIVKTERAEASGALISLDGMTPALLLSRNAWIHIQADEYGVYLSVGDCLYRADTRYFRWAPLAQADGTVLLLRHAAGRLLTVTENELALVYQENGAWKRKIANGSFTIADLSEIVFTGQARRF